MKTPPLSKPRARFLARLGFVCLGLALTAGAALRTSSTYNVPTESLSSAGSQTTSTNYVIEGDLGGIGPGLE